MVVSKKCIPFSTEDENYKAPACFYANEGLDYSAWQYNEVLKQLTKKFVKNSKKVLVIGHSEGSDVAAKLGTLNKTITHIGFWAGGANTQYYDFALFIRKKRNEGKQQLDSVFSQLKEIEANPNSTSKRWIESTYRRWHHFSEPPIGNLLKIKVPVFVAHGAKDTSVPVESALLIPVEFIRHKKNNLTFKLYPEYDHSFNKVFENEPEKYESHWMDVFEDFMDWVNP